jgi:tripeptide aminopeptidase
MTRVLPDPPAGPLELFLALARIPSPTQHEGELAGQIQAWLEKAGIPFTVDDASVLTGSDTGNIVVRRGASPDRATVLFVAHLDTVQPVGSVVEPVVGDDGVVRSAGDTILGADNKAAVAALLSLLVHGRADHANLVAVFSTCEERGRMGVTALEGLAPEVDFAFPVDGSYPVGTVIEAALGQIPFDLRVTGRTAHAAKAPERGIHALKAAADIVAGLKMGWSEEGLMNVSEMRGGSETNVVPGYAEIRGEVRGFSDDEMAAALRALDRAAREVADRTGVTVELGPRPQDGAPPFSPVGSARAVEIVAAAADSVGLEVVRERCSVTLEANFLSATGLPTLGIASGGRSPHSSDESLPVAELDRLLAFLDAILRGACGPRERR